MACLPILRGILPAFSSIAPDQVIKPARAGSSYLLPTVAAGTLAIVSALLKNSAVWLHYVFKPLTTILIFAYAWKISKPISRQFRQYVLAGIAASICGDIFLMLPVTFLSSGFISGLASFLIAHLFFLCAFSNDARLFGRPLVFAAFTAIGTINLAILWSGIGTGLKLSVLGYVLCLVAMSSQAVSRHLDLRSRSSRLAASGGTLFMLSDSILAYNKFYAPIPFAAFWILASYYVALHLIARSVAATVISD